MGFARAPPGVARCYLHTRGKGRTSWHPVLPLLFCLRRGRMRFTVRSLGGKLIISAALTLLLCLLLFSTASWLLLKNFYEHEARSDAIAHLTLIKRAYQTQAAPPINNKFASDLVHKTSLNLTVVLCKSGHIRGTTVPDIAALNRHISEKALCTPGAVNIIEDYL